MKLLYSFFLLAFAINVFAVDMTMKERQAIREFMEVASITERFNKGLKAQLKFFIKNHPEIPVEKIQKYEKYLTLSDDQVSGIYGPPLLEHFSVQELRNIARFYRTPSGKKWIMHQFDVYRTGGSKLLPIYRKVRERMLQELANGEDGS